MRGLRSFLGLFVILIALVAYLYLVESEREPGEPRDKVFSVEADAIEELTVRAESGERTTLRKSGDDWQMVEPVSTEPDSAAVSSLTSNISNLELQRVIDDNPADLAEYGLAEPRVEVAFKAGGAERRLLLGRKTPAGTDLYAKLADAPRVFLVASYLDSTFNRETFDLRDKAVLKLDRAAIDALTVETAAGAVRFSKAGGDWRLSAPVDARADAVSVDSLVSRLNTLQMRSIAAAEPSSLAEYGLEKPQATVRIGSGSSEATLLVGGASGDSEVYAKDASKPMVVTIDSTLVDELTKAPGEFRQKDLFDARAFNATHLEITRGGGTRAFEKTTVKNAEGQDEERWRQTAPAAAEVDQTRLNNLLSAITQARASSFADPGAKTGLEAPELTATVKSDGGARAETVAFGRSGEEAYASRAGEPGAAKIESSTLENIVKALEELQKPAAEGDAQTTTSGRPEGLPAGALAKTGLPAEALAKAGA